MRVVFLYTFGIPPDDKYLRDDSWLYLAVRILQTYDENKKAAQLKADAKG